MRKILNRNGWVVLAAIGLVCLAGVNGCARGEKEVPSASVDKIQQTNTDGFEKVSAIDMSLQWKVVGDRLHVVLSAPTTGWVAVGFDPTRMMQDANFILGYVDDVGAQLRDDYGNWLTSHASDIELGGTDNVLQHTGTEIDGRTTIQFAILLDSGDEFDRPLSPGSTYTVLLAYGNRDDFTSMHRNKTKVEIVL